MRKDAYAAPLCDVPFVTSQGVVSCSLFLDTEQHKKQMVGKGKHCCCNLEPLKLVPTRTDE